jgi:Bacterial regulatory proteins, lacI family
MICRIELDRQPNVARAGSPFDCAERRDQMGRTLPRGRCRWLARSLLKTSFIAKPCATVGALRRNRFTGKQIAIEVGVSAATVSRVLRRLGLNGCSALEPP